MGSPKGFMEFDREGFRKRPVDERVRDWREIYQLQPEPTLRVQGARCMDCGIPFCMKGCPLGNVIPDWNDLVYRDKWAEALDRLHATNNFPEFTGRLCPAPCESSCVLAINSDAVTIKQIELAIVERGWESGWITPQPPAKLTGKRVAVVGSGPAGLAAAQQLARAGHAVTVFERADRVGGLLVYGIPEFKMEKHVVERRVVQMEAEGVTFRLDCHVGVDLPAQELQDEYDAILLSGGACVPRDLLIPGRDLDGIHFAMDYLTPANKTVLGDQECPPIDAADKHVVIVGGGDTGADCYGTAIRQGCRSVVQFQIHSRPPDRRADENPWPQFEHVFQQSGAHEEGGERAWQIRTVAFQGDEQGHVRGLSTVHIEEHRVDGRANYVEVPGTEQVYPADLVLIAIGYAGAERGGLVEQLGVELDARHSVAIDELHRTSVKGVFAAGDMTRGQSLIVWAIAEGRNAAHGIDQWLMGETHLPQPLAHGERARPFA